MKGDANGKIWLEPAIEKAYMHEFTKAEEKDIEELVEKHYEYLKQKWYEYFTK